MAIRLKKILALALACIMIVGLTATTALAIDPPADLATRDQTLTCTLDVAGVNGTALTEDSKTLVYNPSPSAEGYDLQYTATMDMQAMTDLKAALTQVATVAGTDFSDIAGLSGTMNMTIGFPAGVVVADNYQDPTTMTEEMTAQMTANGMDKYFEVDTAYVEGNALIAQFSFLPGTQGAVLKAFPAELIFKTPVDMLTMPQEKYEDGKTLDATGEMGMNLSINIPTGNEYALQLWINNLIETNTAPEGVFESAPTAPVSAITMKISGNAASQLGMEKDTGVQNYLIPEQEIPYTLTATGDAVTGGKLTCDTAAESMPVGYTAELSMTQLQLMQEALRKAVDGDSKFSDLVTMGGTMVSEITFPAEMTIADKYLDATTMKTAMETELAKTLMAEYFVVDSATVTGNKLTVNFTFKPDVKGIDIKDISAPLTFDTPADMLSVPKASYEDGKALVTTSTLSMNNVTMAIPEENDYQTKLMNRINQMVDAGKMPEYFTVKADKAVAVVEVPVVATADNTLTLEVTPTKVQDYTLNTQKPACTLTVSGPQVSGNNLTYNSSLTSYPLTYTATLPMTDVQKMQEALRAAVDGDTKFSDLVDMSGKMTTELSFPTTLTVADKYKDDATLLKAMQDQLAATDMAAYLQVDSAHIDANNKMTVTFSVKDGIKGIDIKDISADLVFKTPDNMFSFPASSFSNGTELKATGNVAMDILMGIPQKYQAPLMNTINGIVALPGDNDYFGYKATYPVETVIAPIKGTLDNTLTLTGKTDGGGGGQTTPVKYTLTFSTDGGSAVSSITSDRGTTIQLTQTTSKNDYVFGGWYLDEALTQKVTEVTLNKNTTVYAKWELKNTGADFDRSDHFAYIIGYEDGNVRPMANVTRGETATIFFRLLTDASRKTYWKTSNTFSDVNSSIWFNNAVSTVGNAGLVNGYEDGTFGGNKPITRAEFATIAVRANGGTGVYTGTNHFGDTSTSWANGYINQAVEMGLIAGYEDGTFRPNNYITRAEAMTLMNRFLGRDKVDATSVISGMITWPDNDETGAWYYYDVQEATNSHDYTRKSDNIEQWTAINAVKDWEALEKAWSTLNS